MSHSVAREQLRLALVRFLRSGGTAEEAQQILAAVVAEKSKQQTGAMVGKPQGQVRYAPAAAGAGQEWHSREGQKLDARPETAAGRKALAAFTRDWLLEEAEQFTRRHLNKPLGACQRDELTALAGRAGKLQRLFAGLASAMQPGAAPLAEQLGAEDITARARAVQKENAYA